MTRKEKAVQEYMEAMTANGCDESMARYYGGLLLKNRTKISDIEEKTAKVRAAKAKSMAKIERREFLESPEGVEFIQKINREISNLTEHRDESRKEWIRKISASFKPFIDGTSYRVAEVRDNVIILRNSTVHDIKISFETDLGRTIPMIHVRKFTEPLSALDAAARDYYAAVSKLFTCSDALVKAVGERLSEISAELDEINSKIEDLVHRKSNPLDNPNL